MAVLRSRSRYYSSVINENQSPEMCASDTAPKKLVKEHQRTSIETHANLLATLITLGFAAECLLTNSKYAAVRLGKREPIGIVTHVHVQSYSAAHSPSVSLGVLL